MARYEAHLTFDRAHAEAVRAHAETHAGTWVYSVITGCPLLGSGTYCYLTGYSLDDPLGLRSRLDAVATQLTAIGAPPLRRKIERIVYDSRTGVDEVFGTPGYGG